MQIDFHHAVTYVTARIAGFTHEEADIVAYSAQYVDDSTSRGIVCFDNHALYLRISSAHKSIDLVNLVDAENHLVWLPFHFLPGNDGKNAGEKYEGRFINKIVCIPDSPPAREMVQAAIESRGKPYGLHRLGIALHVYADTWAHQGFAGVLHEVNEVEDAEETGASGVYANGLQNFLSRFLEDAIPPLGHGRAREFPDMPFLSWQYRNGLGKLVQRNNTEIFCQAADALCKAMQAYRGVSAVGIGLGDMSVIRGQFTNLKAMDGEIRHQRWIETINNGVFSFGSAQIAYADKGPKSWKAQALGTSLDLPVHSYKDEFLSSNWRLFHDALQLHRVTVLHDILPKYGICAG